MLREVDETVPAFCEKHGLDRFHIDRLLRGQVKRSPPVDIVLAIQRATDGRVEPGMWAVSTLRWDEAPATPAAESGPDVTVTDEPEAAVG